MVIIRHPAQGAELQIALELSAGQFAASPDSRSARTRPDDASPLAPAGD
jgi:hypothetical protein